MIKIEFDTGNAAFNNCEGIESARILAKLCQHLEFHGENELNNETIIIKDLNGNTIETMKTESDQEPEYVEGDFKHALLD